MSVKEILHAFVKKNDELLNTINECERSICLAPNIPGIHIKDMLTNSILLLQEKKKNLVTTVVEFLQDPENYKEEIKIFIS